MANLPDRNRIGSTDSTIDVLMKMAEGNPGGVTVLMNMIQKDNWQTPVAGGLIYVMYLDEWGIYGSTIWKLWKDCCDQDWVTFETVLQNKLKGYLTLVQLKEHIGDDYHRGRPFENLKSIEEMFSPEPNIGFKLSKASEPQSPGEQTLLDWVKAHRPELEMTSLQEDTFAHVRLPELTMITPWESKTGKLSEWELINEMITAYTAWREEQEEIHE